MKECLRDERGCKTREKRKRKSRKNSTKEKKEEKYLAEEEMAKNEVRLECEPKVRREECEGKGRDGTKTRSGWDV